MESKGLGYKKKAFPDMQTAGTVAIGGILLIRLLTQTWRKRNGRPSLPLHVYFLFLRCSAFVFPAPQLQYRFRIRICAVEIRNVCDERCQKRRGHLSRQECSHSERCGCSHQQRELRVVYMCELVCIVYVVSYEKESEKAA